MALPRDLLLDDRELARSVIRRLVGNLEWVALLLQTSELVKTALLDKVTENGQLVLFGLAGVHAAAALAAYRYEGPFANGGPWPVLWFGATLCMPLVMAHLVGAWEYGASPTCVQLCGYPIAPLVVFSFFPWWPGEPRWGGGVDLRRVVAGAVVTAILVEPLLLVLYLHRDPGFDNYLGVAMSALICLFSFIAGKAVGRICHTAVDSQNQLKNESFGHFYDFLHSELKNRLLLARTELDDLNQVRARLDQMNEVIAQGRTEMLLAASRVPLAHIVSRRLEMFESTLAISGSARVGETTVGTTVARVLDQALSDLLSNSVAHAGSVRVDCTVHGEGWVRLEIVDDGPGFAATVLDDESTSLHRLRRAARELGGDLTHTPPATGGAGLTLELPLRSRHRRRRSR
ncbi:ATP-binding protein [Salinactinospora qingdaonensis]|uniref:Histidine kinase/HSP90-like ATPase domain-containing protein n=1 Tax=Salinactinospora qingdaonensis TaxID=702744 RepID=A0ABP7FFX9_9ACTN